MRLTLKLEYAEGQFDTRTAVLVPIPGNGSRGERQAEIAIRDGTNYVVGSIDLGLTQVEDANRLAEEIVRRFNDFPEELKR